MPSRNALFSWYRNKQQERIVRSALSKANAYWISPEGEILPVSSSHVDFVIENSQKFQTTREQVEHLFQRDGEEGVLREIVGKGWVRVRYQAERYYIAVQRYNSTAQNLISRWAIEEVGIYKDRRLTKAIVEEEGSGLLFHNTLMGLAEDSLQSSKVIDKSSRDVILQVRGDFELWSLIPKKLLKSTLDALGGD